ncbi:hypothetical protein F7734_53410 [Scytonema sp. UIC 10036]|uniref:hypothetical protein n=1 Tax=Scytonema sp. UIC 10036 TaxID=2304196 RepID=UPI0012DA6367|nr:hypothetical protein [Scytonema sp. UIC 10036]MUH00608.1 hypothetical protein [Scytonema sp. UIC 10036]
MKTDNQEFLLSHSQETNAVQLALPLGISSTPQRELLPDGRPTAGQRWKDALADGTYEGSFLEFCRWEMRRDAQDQGFRCVADYFAGIAMGMKAEEYYSEYLSALDTVSEPCTYTAEQLSNDEYKPKRQWSVEAKQRNRLKRLQKRISKQYTIPDLYEKELANAIAAKPEYYGV